MALFGKLKQKFSDMKEMFGSLLALDNCYDELVQMMDTIGPLFNDENRSLRMQYMEKNELLSTMESGTQAYDELNNEKDILLKKFIKSVADNENMLPEVRDKCNEALAKVAEGEEKLVDTIVDKAKIKDQDTKEEFSKMVKDELHKDNE